MFITFEGIDGSGKSTQIKKLRQKLADKGRQVEVYRDPGGPEVSERVRDLLLSPDYEIDPVTELLLFSSARSQLMAECVLPDLQDGEVVILDRFYDSTTAYQGHGRKSVPLDEIHKMNAVASHGHEPDLTIYMQLSFDDALHRMPKDKDRMEQSGDHFYKNVIAGYNHLSKAKDRFFTVDAMLPPDRVAELIWNHLSEYLAQNEATD